jgi:heat shock protein HslJ
MTQVFIGLTLAFSGLTGHAVASPAMVADVARADIARMLRLLEPTQAGGTQAVASGPRVQDGLSGTAWRAVDLDGIPVPAQQLPPDREPHLVFDVDGHVSGVDGCNRITGSYTVNGNWLEFGPFAGTQMFCQNTEKVTRRFQEALKGCIRWSILAGRLQLYGPTGKPLAVFERRDAPPSAPAG